MEETKAQEITRLQEALRASQIQMEEAKSKAIQEQEVARKAIKEALPVIKETPVIVQDTKKIDALTAEIESLKVGTLSNLDCLVITNVRYVLPNNSALYYCYKEILWSPKTFCVRWMMLLYNKCLLSFSFILRDHFAISFPGMYGLGISADSLGIIGALGTLW